ncbi:CPBP family intramembrane glutamic endopeptidase [Hyphobacterium sp.]|uniref:CPBP family intramembrane glutamic endopeptidase n=1 Tax=Hyphobacterium sp. TaxID=2004662 RepID=UPI003B51C9EC
MLVVENGIVRAAAARNRHPIGITGFFILTFVLSWAGAAAVLLQSHATTGAGWAVANWHDGFAPLSLLMLFGPLLATIMAMIWNYGPGGVWRFVKRAFRIKFHPLLWLSVLALPALVAAAVWPISGLTGDTASPPALWPTVLVSAGQIGLFYLVFNTEELAWRGYALPQLQARLSPLGANAVLTLIWLVFHLPLFAMPSGHPAGYGILPFVFMVIPIGFIMGAVFNRAAGSVLVVHVLHQGFNAWGEAWQIFPVFTESPVQIWVFVGLLWIPGLVAIGWLAMQRRPA